MKPKTSLRLALAAIVATASSYRAQKWTIVLLMAAALSYGLLASLAPARANVEPVPKGAKKAAARKRKLGTSRKIAR
jgi:hypothetical protein